MEDSKNDIELKPNVGTDVETSLPPTMETQPNSSTDVPSNLTMDTPPLDLEPISCKPDITEHNNTSKESYTAEGVPEPKSVETVPVTIEADCTEVVKNSTTSPVTMSPKPNELKTAVDLNAKESPTELSLQPPAVAPLTPPLQLPQNNSNPEPLEPVKTEKTTKVSTETRACTVRLEILTESDIVKHVHVHRIKGYFSGNCRNIKG